MIRSPRMWALQALLGASSLLASPGAHACSCTNDRTVLEEFGIASTVFAGTVTDVQPVGDGYNVIATFTPTTRWKGGLDPFVTVYTPADEGICGFLFVVGESYLVFAFDTVIDDQQVLWTHVCSRNGLLADHPDVNRLPPPLLPVPVRRHSWGELKTVYR